MSILVEKDDKDRMYNIIKYEIKHFNNFDVTVYGKYNDIFFKANEIGSLLDIKDINYEIKRFDKDEILYTDIKESVLTEQGMYRLLMMYDNDIVKKFRKWIFKVIKEIRVREIYELKRELQNKEIEYKQNLQENVMGIDKLFKGLNLKYEDIELKTDVKITSNNNVNTIEIIIDFEISID
jgi:prophage antirepressor-like protein